MSTTDPIFFLQLNGSWIRINIFIYYGKKKLELYEQKLIKKTENIYKS